MSNNNINAWNTAEPDMDSADKQLKEVFNTDSLAEANERSEKVLEVLNASMSNECVSVTSETTSANDIDEFGNFEDELPTDEFDNIPEATDQQSPFDDSDFSFGDGFSDEALADEINSDFDDETEELDNIWDDEPNAISSQTEEENAEPSEITDDQTDNDPFGSGLNADPFSPDCAHSLSDANLQAYVEEITNRYTEMISSKNRQVTHILSIINEELRNNSTDTWDSANYIKSVLLNLQIEIMKLL